MRSDVFLAAKALLFDCDGVLVDSDASVIRAWTRWAHQYRLPPTQVLAMVHGRRSADTVAALIDDARRAEALAAIDSFELEDAVTVSAISGACVLLALVPPSRWAVVTSGTASLAKARMAAAGIPMPSAVITADDVSAGKPDPEGYLAGAQALGVDTRDAIVLEDSVGGVLAARRARVAAVVGVQERAIETDADVVVRDLHGVRWTGSGLHIGGSAALRG